MAPTDCVPLAGAAPASVVAELDKVKSEYASYRRRAMELIKEKEDLVRPYVPNSIPSPHPPHPIVSWLFSPCRDATSC